MDRRAFGKLVQALRTEHVDRDDNSWTQQDFATRINRSKRTIERLEEGSLKKIDADLVRAMADALALTTVERREFFLAAFGADSRDVVSQKRSTVQLERILEVLEATRLPAFVVDVYADIVAANTCVIQLLEVSATYLAQIACVPDGYNVMRVVFSPHTSFRTQMGNQWYAVANHNIQRFRGYSLRYRTNPYFGALLKALRTYPAFVQAWETAHLDEHDSTMEHIRYRYDHRTFGPLDYVATIAPSITSHGELYAVVYLPLNTSTRLRFDHIANQHGTTMQRFAPWPKPSA